MGVIHPWIFGSGPLMLTDSVLVFKFRSCSASALGLLYYDAGCGSASGPGPAKTKPTLPPLQFLSGLGSTPPKASGPLRVLCRTCTASWVNSGLDTYCSS